MSSLARSSKRSTATRLERARQAPSPRAAGHAGRLLLFATRLTPTNSALVRALRRAGVESSIVPPDEAARVVRPEDSVLGRLDVLPSLSGPEPGLWALMKIERDGVHVLNGPTALLACHDKLTTALRLARAGLPHPRTAHVEESLPELDPPLVLKPRFGSRGREVRLCDSRLVLASELRRLSTEGWFRRHGALVQELVPWNGFELRLLVAADQVVAAGAQIARQQPWQSNPAVAGSRRQVTPPPEACRLAIAAARAAGAILVAVDLLPLASGGYVVLDMNAAVEFHQDYALETGDVFDEVARRLRLVQLEARAGPSPA